MKKVLIWHRITILVPAVAALLTIGVLAYLAIPSDKLGISILQLIVAVMFSVLLPLAAVRFVELVHLKKKTYSR